MPKQLVSLIGFVIVHSLCSDASCQTSQLSVSKPEKNEPEFINPDSKPLELKFVGESQNQVEFLVKNIKSFPLEFVGAKASCSCASISIDKGKFSPGEEAILKVVSRSVSSPERQITAVAIAATFRNSDPQDVRQYVFSQDVKFINFPQLEWSQTELQFIRGDDLSRQVRVINWQKKVCNNPRIRVNPPFVKVKRIEQSTEDPFAIELELLPSDDFNWNNEHLELEFELFDELTSTVRQLIGKRKIPVKFKEPVSIVPKNLFLDSPEPEVLIMSSLSESEIKSVVITDIRQKASLSVQDTVINGRLHRVRFDVQQLRNLVGESKEHTIQLQVTTSAGTTTNHKITVFNESN